jgi:hypothetical protein
MSPGGRFVEHLEAEQRGPAEQRRVDLEVGVLGGGTDEVSSPLSTLGSSASCWALLKRWTSSRNRIVPWLRSPRRCWARATTSRTSLTPAVTAESVSKALAVCPAITWARVVFPVPGGPQRITDDRRSASISTRRGARGRPGGPGPRCRRGVRGRSRSASGARRARRSVAAAAKRSSATSGTAQLLGGPGTASTPASLRCAAVMGAGAAVSGSKPPPVFGNAMTSRIDDALLSRAQMRSQPKAMPPWGGAP